MKKQKMKNCINCGAPLLEGAAFCPCCTATQIDRQGAAMPTTQRKKTRVLLWTALALLIVAALWGVHSRQETTATDKQNAALKKLAETDPYLAACQTYYTGEDGREYHVFTAFTPEGDGSRPMGYLAELIMEGQTNDFPITVIVQDAVSGELTADTFAQLLEDWDVAVNAGDGVGRVSLKEVQEEAAESPALLYRRAVADATCSHNEVVWTLRMKNGDHITLTQTLECGPREERYYHYSDTPMNTAEELQTLLDTIAAECTADVLVTVFLPNVTYDQAVTVPCSVELMGNGTVFAAPVRVTALEDTDLSYAYVRFNECSFTGDGQGTGLTAGAPTYFEECSLTGWDIGGEAVDGGWLYLRKGYVGENRVGVRYNSAFASTYCYDVRDMEFAGNGTALELTRFPTYVYMELRNCAFSNNDIDISNPNGYTVNTENTNIMQ